MRKELQYESDARRSFYDPYKIPYLTFYPYCLSPGPFRLHPLPGGPEKEPLKRWLADHAQQIEETAEDYLASQGHPQEVSFELTSDYFPTKAYGDMVFPCGTYDAARITIGRGKGRNWWCVLYPSLCFTDPVTAKVPEPSKRKLSALLDETDYEALRAEEKPELHVRLRLLDTVSALLSD